MSNSDVQPEMNRETKRTRERYDRIAPIYDSMEILSERFGFSHWRPLLWRRVRGPRVLEIGVGTGKNFPYYPAGMEITGIDISPAMMARARSKAACDRVPITLEVADAQNLPFADNSFDTVVATCVFCSIPDPVKGLQEARRVLKPGGQLLLLEHVLSSTRVLNTCMKVANPAVVRMIGANINRQTADNVERGGLRLVSVENLWLDIVQLIEAEAVKEDA